MTEGKVGVQNFIADPRVEIKFFSRSPAVIKSARLDLWPDEIHLVMRVSYDYENLTERVNPTPITTPTHVLHFEFVGPDALAKIYDAFEGWGIGTRLGAGFNAEALVGRTCVRDFTLEGPESLSFTALS